MYVAVKGGERAIENAHAYLAEERRGDTSIAERTTYDLWYVENWSMWLDIKIIVRTMYNMAMRRDKNAY